MAPLLKFYSNNPTIYRHDHTVLNDGLGTKFYIFVEDILKIDMLNRRTQVRTTINGTVMNIWVEFTQSKKK
jgi:hypothetical protein